eukprot:scaffold66729_cov33-Tisochrysis_lutea.AAC.4
MVPRGRAAASTPPSVTLPSTRRPSLGSPASAERSVDFPEPDGPKMPCVRPGCSRSETGASICRETAADSQPELLSGTTATQNSSTGGGDGNGRTASMDAAAVATVPMRPSSAEAAAHEATVLPASMLGDIASPAKMSPS